MATTRIRLTRAQSIALVDWLRNNSSILTQHTVPTLTEKAIADLGFHMALRSITYTAGLLGLRVGMAPIVVKPVDRIATLEASVGRLDTNVERLFELVNTVLRTVTVLQNQAHIHKK